MSPLKDRPLSSVIEVDKEKVLTGDGTARTPSRRDALGDYFRKNPEALAAPSWPENDRSTVRLTALDAALTAIARGSVGPSTTVKQGEA
jgi:hypothetical protein